jgi:exopolysaccharide production protein ExoZ
LWATRGGGARPPPTPRQALGSLEIGRFIAASIVVLMHLKEPIVSHTAPGGVTIFGNLDFPGPLAVQYFFVLSGFVMMTAHGRDFGRKGAALTFWWRRACRIYPMYWIALIIPLFYLYAEMTPARWAEQLTLQPVNITDLVASAWSLRFEIGFYVMFGLCLLPYIGRFLLFFWIAVVCYGWCAPSILHMLHLPIGFVLGAFYNRYDHGFLRPASFFSPDCFYFFSGLLGGWVFSRLRGNAAAAWVLLVAGLAGLLLTLPQLQGGFQYGTLAASIHAGLAFAAIMTGAAMLERQGVLRLGSLARRLGAMSYPLYILHMPLLFAFHQQLHFRLSGRAATAGLAVALLIFIYGVAALFTFGVDQPLQNWLRRRRAGPVLTMRQSPVQGRL